MRLDDFDYALPEELIALRPVRPRRASRLLVAAGDGIADSTVARLGDWLEPGDLLVFNDTRVVPARLRGLRRRAGGTGAEIEATLVTRTGEGR
jgi:S-adenosylmethionine:tRNA ribosyltransferase-isomerase